jgi:SPP1 family predicted phage head-tail adaptor
MTRIGQLRHRVVIEQKAVSQDSYGAPVETWSTLATVWASVDDLSAREGIQGRAELQSVTTVIRMRNRADVSAENRVTWGSHTYDIQGVVRGERRTHMELLCVEAV